MSELESDKEEDPDIRFIDLAPAVEFCCWVVVALCPFLRWVNGAAVTQDQFVIQVTLFSLALTGAISLRIYLFVAIRRKSKENLIEETVSEDTVESS